jgi:hypothetical protein
VLQASVVVKVPEYSPYRCSALLTPMHPLENSKQHINKRDIKMNAWEGEMRSSCRFVKIRKSDLRENLNMSAIAALHLFSRNLICSYPHVTPSLGDMLLQIALFLKVT